ncbi:MAG: hypothetical protein J0H35_05330, partial [Rhodospirillales bacterium]|nr:hypothetical protein [Rhodospirillales bacterium]
ESMQYSYSFSPEIQQEWRWPETFSAQPDILRYAGFVADKLDLRRDMWFETKVTGADDDGVDLGGDRRAGGILGHGSSRDGSRRAARRLDDEYRRRAAWVNSPVGFRTGASDRRGEADMAGVCRGGAWRMRGALAQGGMEIPQRQTP